MSTDQNTAESIKADASVAAERLQEAAESGRTAATTLGMRAFRLWADLTEIALQTTFKVQNAALDLTLNAVDQSTRSNGAFVRRWSDVAHEAQETALDTFYTVVRSVDRVLAGDDVAPAVHAATTAA